MGTDAFIPSADARVATHIDNIYYPFGHSLASALGSVERIEVLKGLKSQPGRRLYALRKQTVEPVFGIIKSVMGFRQFLLRGMGKVSGEWRLVCLAWNLKRMAVLRHKSVSCR